MNERSIDGIRVARPTKEDIHRLKVGDWAPDISGGWHLVARISYQGQRTDGKLFVAYFTDRVGAPLSTILVQDEECNTLELGDLIVHGYPTWGEMDKDTARDVADELVRLLLPEDLGHLNGEELPDGGPLRDRIERICRDTVQDHVVVDVGLVVDIASQSDEAYEAAEKYWPVWPRRRAWVPVSREGV